MPTLGPGSQIYLKRTIEDLQPVVRTSKPYPLEKLDAVSLVTPMIVGGKLRVEPNDLGEINLVSPVIVSGSFRDDKVFNTITEVSNGVANSYNQQAEMYRNFSNNMPVQNFPTLNRQKATYNCINTGMNTTCREQ